MYNGGMPCVPLNETADHIEHLCIHEPIEILADIQKVQCGKQLP